MASANLQSKNPPHGDPHLQKPCCEDPHLPSQNDNIYIQYIVQQPQNRYKSWKAKNIMWGNIICSIMETLIFLGGNMFLIYHIIICIYMCVWAAVKINCWCLVRKYRLSLFGGGLSLYSVLLKSTLNNAKMQRNWLHGFRSLKCWEWNSKLLSLRLQPCWELSKHIPRLFPKEGYLLQTQLWT